MDEQDLMPFFMEIHSDNPREGPGSRKTTTRAFQLMTKLPSRPRILDVGCGPGMQTLDLARLTGGDITAVDNHLPYLEVLRSHINAQGLETRVRTVNGDMTTMGFGSERFDLIWSEGAIYIMGFEEGLHQWRPLLKPGGYLAVTELSWLIDNSPEAVRVFWAEGYPAMQTIGANLAIIEASGYQLINHFTLPSSDWWEEYYNPIAAKLPAFREKYHANTVAQKVADMELAEMRLFREYETTYGYVFYTMRRVD